jgi:hypothetical protein
MSDSVRRSPHLSGHVASGCRPSGQPGALRLQGQPRAPSPRPSAPGSPTPAASLPASRRRATLPHVPRGHNRPDAVTSASAMPEPPPAASTANRDHRPIPPRRSPAPDGAAHHRLPVAPLLRAIQQRARAAPPVAAGAARPGALRLLRQRPHHRNHQPGHPRAGLRRGPRLASPHAL